jgi:ribosomal protein S18 acetylase RimI-like enzyme
MVNEEIRYAIKTANERDIYVHLKNCKDNFMPPLTQRVVLEEYARKIYLKSVTFEAWREHNLVGLLAIYFNNTPSKYTAFITNVSVLKENMRFGIASALMNMCIEYAHKNNFDEINLEVFPGNKDGVAFYTKFNFINVDLRGEPLLMKLKILK